MPNPLPPGPELDRLIAEKVMGWHYVSYRMGLGDSGYWAVAGTRQSEAESNWSPSTNIAHAWRVLEAVQLKFREGIASVVTEVVRSAAGNPDYRYQVAIIERIYEPSGWAATDGKYTTIANAKTAPHAICLAAIAALSAQEKGAAL